jgi:hypothetical protein
MKSSPQLLADLTWNGNAFCQRWVKSADPALVIGRLRLHSLGLWSLVAPSEQRQYAGGASKLIARRSMPASIRQG